MPPAPPAMPWIRRSLRASGLALAVLATLWGVLVVRAPLDSHAGRDPEDPLRARALRLLGLRGLHRHGARAARSTCGATTSASTGFAAASAEVGVVFCTLVILTGPIWAKGTWGHWWAWDPRLTVTLLLWFVYLAYLLLRSFTEGSARTARFAAVYGIAGVLAIPLNYFAIQLVRRRRHAPRQPPAREPGGRDGLALRARRRRPVSPPTCTCSLLRTDLESLRAEAVDAERPRGG